MKTSRFLIPASLVIVLLLTGQLNGSKALAQVPDYIREVRRIYTSDVGADRPSGVAHIKDSNTFLLLERSKAGMLKFFATTPYKELVDQGTISLPVSGAFSSAYDNFHDRLFILDHLSGELYDIGLKLEGSHRKVDNTGAAVYRMDGLFLAGRTGGITVDPETGELYVLSAAGSELTRIYLDGNPTSGSRAARSFGVSDSIPHPQGIAFNPQDRHLYVLCPSIKTVFELSLEGEVLAAHDLSGFHLNSPRGLVIAQSGDPTDEPENMNLYVLDAARTPEGTMSIAEFALHEPVIALSDTIPTVYATLERKTLTSAFYPPSPDPSGVTYLLSLNTLLICDSEVEEMPPYFTGKNLFEVTLYGQLVNTYTTTGFSGEPTGIAYDTARKYLFISDDDRGRVFTLKLGSDGLINTSDDTVSYFKTSSFGSYDPEGVAYDSWRGHLMVIDGLGAEVYDISPGPNSVFDGVLAPGDDIVTHFDTAAIGIIDPEGIAFDPTNGHVYIMSNRSGGKIAELTVEGALQRYIDIKSLGAYFPAGLGVAPASTNPSKMNLYMVARGVDNGNDPYENDGVLYEISFPLLNPEVNNAPLVNSGPDQSVPIDTSLRLTGSVIDDGLPVGSQLTMYWEKFSGLGTANFTPADMPITDVSFSVEGIYVLRLNASDGELTAYDDVVVTVNPPAPVNAAPQVNAGEDQTIAWGASAMLSGTVTDDGLPSSSLTYDWKKFSGPGDVIFSNPDALTTQASFTVYGDYVLDLAASDGVLTGYDQIGVKVSAPPAVGTIDIRVNASSDDAEESAAGVMNLKSTDLELVYNIKGGNQTVGIRFNKITIPTNATISKAYIQFTAAARASSTTALTIHGEDVDNSATFSTTSGNISRRIKTTAYVSWTPAAWTVKMESSSKQQTPDLKSIVQEIVSLPRNMTEYSISFIISGTGIRSAVPFDLLPASAPLLHVEYSTLGQ